MRSTLKGDEKLVRDIPSDIRWWHCASAKALRNHQTYLRHLETNGFSWGNRSQSFAICIPAMDESILNQITFFEGNLIIRILPAASSWLPNCHHIFTTSLEAGRRALRARCHRGKPSQPTRELKPTQNSSKHLISTECRANHGKSRQTSPSWKNR